MWLFIFLIIIMKFFYCINCIYIESLSYKDPSVCNKSEIFNKNLMKCEICSPNLLLVPSINKETCICNERSIPKYDVRKLLILKCEKCNQYSIYSKATRTCIKCTNGLLTIDNRTICKPCRENEIMVYKFTNGTSLSQTKCIPCANGMIPSNDGTECIPCQIINPYIYNNGTILKCECDYNKSILLGNVCVPKHSFPELLNTKKNNKYFLQYGNGPKINSYLFDTYLKQTIFLCKLGNSTACQFLANLCTLTLFSSYTNSPCNLWMESKYFLNPSAVSVEFLRELPWLFYREGEANIILKRKKISAQYTLNSDATLPFMNKLNFSGIIFNLDGTVKEVRHLIGNDLNLCPDLSNSIKNKAFRFGVNYQYECYVDAKQFFNEKQTEFIVPYLQYWENDISMLYAVPVLIKNLEQYKNNNEDPSNWQLVRRFFLFDIISSVGERPYNLNENIRATVLRYVKSIEIKVQLRNHYDNDDDEDDYYTNNNNNYGMIYPPMIILEYGEISQQQYDRDEKIHFKFSTRYEMKHNMKYYIEIIIGVLCGFAIIYSGIETWSHSKRSAKISIDLWTLIRICLFACGNLANIFFIVAFCISLYIFIVYKGQNAVYLLLSIRSEEIIIKNFIIVAFVLKIIDILILIWNQISIDIFLIDWEKPKPQDTIPRPIKNKKSSTFTLLTSSASSFNNCSQQSVSIWRSCFIANEWYELQTIRKINLLTHMLCITFLFKVIGLEYWATVDPELHTTIPEYLKNVPLNFVFIFAVGNIVYILVYIIQLLFMTCFYERYIQNYIQQFVDLCSLANISIFIMSLEIYGYYIHGRSSHGFADKDMVTMLKQLKREEDDLCAYRGLLPGSHHQTFSVGIPTKLRLNFNKIMAPVIKYHAQRSAETSKGNFTETSPRTKTIIDSMQFDHFETMSLSYLNMNKFLSAFLEHALKDLDYDIKEKLFVEKLLDIEFTDCFQRGIFYNDSGHSFDRVLFYGNEFCLFFFDIILFSFLLIISEDFILTILISLCTIKIIEMVRCYAGKRNFAQKTFIDERFLI